MADDALRRICGAFGDDIIRELIRAREMGQREGREDAAREQSDYVRVLEKDRAALGAQVDALIKERVRACIPSSEHLKRAGMVGASYCRVNGERTLTTDVDVKVHGDQSIIVTIKDRD